MPDGGPLGGTGPGGEGDGGSALPVAIGPGGLGVRTATDADGLGDLGIRNLGGLDVSQIWFVPAGLLGGPGLLVILWVALQVTAGMAWLPATRRLRGEERHERRIAKT